MLFCKFLFFSINCRLHYHFGHYFIIYAYYNTILIIYSSISIATVDNILVPLSEASLHVLVCVNMVSRKLIISSTFTKSLCMLWLNSYFSRCCIFLLPEADSFFVTFKPAIRQACVESTLVLLSTSIITLSHSLLSPIYS